MRNSFSQFVPWYLFLLFVSVLVGWLLACSVCFTDLFVYFLGRLAPGYDRLNSHKGSS